MAKILADHNKTGGEINIIITNDYELTKINKKYLKRNNYTDIITFDYSLKNEINGELFISIERVQENAINYRVSEKNELLRVIIHGLLHLIGYDDIEKKKIKKMKSMENYYLENYFKNESKNM
jgi:rRNA maturation RNase YbeY